MKRNKNVDGLISKEVSNLLKEYYDSIKTGRQKEVQEFLLSRVERETLEECIGNPVNGRMWLRDKFPGRFYWWANEDIENMLKNWSN